MIQTRKQKIGRFELTGKLGRGSQGSVYLALDPVLARQVAIKLLHEVADTPGKQAFYLAEGRHLARLRHPNIVSLYEAGNYIQRPYLVFEYVKGQTLRTCLRDKTISSRQQALQLIRQILDAMAYAHAREIMHLDLSPENIMIDHDGNARIMDFGLSTHTMNKMPATASVAGTPCYLSPEHVTSGKRSIRTDVFTLGLIFSEILTGQALIRGSSLEAIFAQAEQARFDLSILDKTHVHPELRTILAKALQRRPEQRFADAGEMSGAFNRIYAEPSRSGDETSHSTVEFLLRRMRRNQDFPAMSSNLLAINKLTGDDSKASVEQLTNVILRDYSITNKLLKLANSSFYGNFRGSVQSVSRAVTILGYNQVRQACNSLILFDKLNKKESLPLLQDSLICSFVSGLIARHIALSLPAIDAEEAFICGMLHNLGGSLCIYYFPDDYIDILALSRQQNTRLEAAAESLLGLKLSSIGRAVAQEWQFPAAITESMQPLALAPQDDPDIPQDATEITALRRLASVSNYLAGAAGDDSGMDTAALTASIERLASPLISLPHETQLALLGAALDKFIDFSRILGLTDKPCQYVEQTGQWLLNNQPDRQQAGAA